MHHHPIARGAARFAGFAVGTIIEFGPFLALIAAGLIVGLILAAMISLAPLPA